MREKAANARSERVLPKSECRERAQAELRLRRGRCPRPVANRHALHGPAPIRCDLDAHGTILAGRGHVAALVCDEDRAGAAGPVPVVGILTVVLALLIRDNDKLRAEQFEQFGAATAFPAMMRGDEHRDVLHVLAERRDREQTPPAGDLKIARKQDLERAELGDYREAITGWTAFCGLASP